MNAQEKGDAYTADLLRDGEAWLQYAVGSTILQEDPSLLSDLHDRALADPKIQALLRDIADFHGILVTSHKNAGLPIHKLLFLLDLGFGMEVPEIKAAVEAILAHKDENGVYQSKINIPRHFGGSGEDTFGWALCDAPLLLLALVKTGVDYDTHIRQGVEYLLGFFAGDGFPCVVSKELGTFRGPGKKSDTCPYASLIMLRLLSEIPAYRDSETVKSLAFGLLSLWERSLAVHPYMFYMGTDFRKLKAPALWYDIVSVADVLSRFDFVRSDPRFSEMTEIIRNKMREDGLFIPESVYQKFKGWDFGQKKQPSLYLTFLCRRIQGRSRQ